MRPLVLSCLLVLLVPAPTAEVAPTATAMPTPAIDVRDRDDPPPMPEADGACAVDADCTRVFRRCGTCDCGSPVNVAALATHEAERGQRCAGVVGPVCEMDCGDTTPRCIAQRCELGRAE